jgi:hypothetical protein
MNVVGLLQIIESLPIISIAFLLIFLYILSLGLRTIKAWLRWIEIKAIAKEFELTQTKVGLKEVIETRIGKGEMSHIIEKELNRQNEKELNKQNGIEKKG